MEGTVSWAQLVFAATLICGSFGVAAWVLLKLTNILVRLEQLATKEDLSNTKKDLYARLDTQWNNWQQAHADLRERVAVLESRRANGHG